MDKNTRLAKNTLIYLIGNFSSTFLSFLLLPLFTRYLSPNEYGEVDIIFAFTSVIAPIITLQASFSCYRFLFDAQDNKDRKVIISNTFAIYAAGIFIFSIAYIIYLQFVDIKYSLVIYAYILASCFSALLLIIVRGLRRNVLYSSLGVIGTISALTANLVFIVGLRYKSMALLLAPICNNIVVIIISSVKLKILDYINFRLIQKSMLTDILRYSIPLVPDAICWWAFSGFGRIFLRYNSGYTAVGILAFANKYPGLLLSFYSIYNLAWNENAFTEFKSSDRDKYYGEIFNGQLVLIICLIIVLLPLTYIAIFYFFPDSYSDALMYIPILYLSSLFRMLSSFFGSGFESAKKTKGIMISTLIALTVNLALNIVLVPAMAIYGTSFAYLFAYAALFLHRVITSKRFFRIKIEYKRVTPIIFILTLYFGLYYCNITILQLILLLISIFIFYYFNSSVIKFLLVKGVNFIFYRLGLKKIRRVD